MQQVVILTPSLTNTYSNTHPHLRARTHTHLKPQRHKNKNGVTCDGGTGWNRARMDARIATDGLIIYPIQGDGNCMMKFDCVCVPHSVGREKKTDKEVVFVCIYARVCAYESMCLTAVGLHLHASTDVLIRAMQGHAKKCDGRGVPRQVWTGEFWNHHPILSPSSRI